MIKRLTAPQRSAWFRLFQGMAAVFALGMSLLIAGAIFFIALFSYFSRDLPDYHSLANYEPATMTRLYASDGSLLDEYAIERRVFVPLDEIPARVIRAFVSAEDQNFFRHSGVDAEGIARAVWENIRHYGQDHSLVGGSTITQQVVKNFLLTNEKSIRRKAMEAILAFRITRAYSKEKILELYLNEIYLGHGAYGVMAASQVYFGKDLAALTTEEVALLAAMPKAPSNYDPFKHYDRAMQRRGYVLERMLEDGNINEEEAQRAYATDIVLAAPYSEPKVSAAYFAEEVRRRLVKSYGSKAVYKGGLYVQTSLDTRLQPLADTALQDALIAYDRRHGYRGALAHFTTTEKWEEKLANYMATKKIPLIRQQRLGVVLRVDPQLVQLGMLNQAGKKQRGKIAFEQLKWAWQKNVGTPRQAGDVVRAGDVIVVTPFIEPEKKNAKNTKENTPDGNAANGNVTEKRLPPEQFVLEQIPEVNGALLAMDPHTGRVLAMSGGYSPIGTEFNRATQAQRQPGSSFKPFIYLAAMERGFTPATIVVDEPVELSQGEGMPLWRPKNYGGEFLGPATLRTGLEKSRNVMTVRLALMLGLERIAAVGERFGIYDTLPKNFSSVLGSYETTLLRLVTAYSSMVNGGYKVTPAFIERIDDRKGKSLYRRDARECAACQSGSAAFRASAPPALADERSRILDPRVAYQMVSLLQGVVQRGTAARAASLGLPLGGKTGTTNDSRDAWFIGFSSDLVVGVFIGYDTPRNLGQKETGGRVALPAFMDFIKEANHFYPAREFDVPPGIEFQQVDRATGQVELPWQTAGTTIREAFITGGAVFIPGENEALPDLQQVAGEEVPVEGALAPETADVGAPSATIIGNEAQRGDIYSQEYYQNYQEQRLKRYQQYMNQRDVQNASQSEGKFPAAGQYSRPRNATVPPAATGTGALY
ncbi:MAG: penicillin-binding protein 1A [Rickettsiales bacterium]|nr:penicillin-binding protein 1A [Rickettsiales bacterium]